MPLKNWGSDREFTCQSCRDEFERISEGLADALDFCRTVGANETGAGFESGGGRGVLGEVDFYTRQVPASPRLALTPGQP